MGITVQTKYGAVDVVAQDGQTAYVRVGTDDLDDTTTEALTLPRGYGATGRGHYALIDGAWTPSYPRFRRADNRDDLTPTMARQVHAAIVDALREQVDAGALARAQAKRNAADRARIVAQMAALERMHDQLRAQATALEVDPGARVVYVKQRLRSGSEQDAMAVRTSEGELRFVDEPRAGLSTSGLRRYLGEPADWIERR